MKGILIICVTSNIGTPIFDASLKISSASIKSEFKTNLCGICKIKLSYGEYILEIESEGFIGRKFKVKFSDVCSFLDIKLEYMDNIIYGYLELDDDSEELDDSIKVNLLYEAEKDKFIKVKECFVDENLKYEFKNVPKGKYKVETEF